MKQEVKRYAVRIFGFMAIYSILLFLSIWLLGRIPLSPWRIPVAVLPAIPLLFVVWSVIHFIRKMDELQKTIHLEAVTFSFLVTMVVAFTYGFLENAGLPPISVLYVPVCMCVLWGIGAGIASRRYR